MFWEKVCVDLLEVFMYVCLRERSTADFPSRIIWLGFCPLSPFSLLLTALHPACWLMVMWRVWLCIRSSGVIFRSCGVPRWHHLYPHHHWKGAPCLIPRFPLEGPSHVWLCLTGPHPNTLYRLTSMITSSVGCSLHLAWKRTFGNLITSGQL